MRLVMANVLKKIEWNKRARFILSPKQKTKHLLAPRDEAMLPRCLRTAVDLNRPCAVRYPRGAAFGVPIGALMIQRYLRGNSPGLQAQGRAMASRHTITYPKVKKTSSTSGSKADKNTQSTVKPVTSSNDGSKK